MTPLLKGIRVVDLTSVIMGPFATAQLGVLGADVIKVEPPSGEAVRHIAPMKTPAMGAGYLNANRNKRSVTLDLKTEEGRAALDRIIATADVFVTNMRRKATEKLLTTKMSPTMPGKTSVVVDFVGRFTRAAVPACMSFMLRTPCAFFLWL